MQYAKTASVDCIIFCKFFHVSLALLHESRIVQIVVYENFYMHIRNEGLLFINIKNYIFKAFLVRKVRC